MSNAKTISKVVPLGANGQVLSSNGTSLVWSTPSTNADTLDSLNSTSFFRTDAANASDARLSSGDGRGLRFWDSDAYKIQMSSTANTTFGGRLDSTSDYNMYFTMSGGTNRGFTFRNASTPVAQIESTGQLRLASNVISNGRILTANNSAVTPAYSFNDDPNTGMFALAADTVGFSTNGTIAAAFTSTGDLRLYNTAGTFYTQFSNQPTSNNTITLPITGDTTIVSGTMATTNTAQSITANKTFTGLTSFDRGAATYTDAFIIQSGAIASGNPGFYFKKANATSLHITGWNGSAREGTIELKNNTIVPSIAAANGSASAPAFDFVNDPNTGIYLIGADTIGFSTNGTIAAAFTSTGNLRLYNTAGTQYIEANSQPTATRYLNLPDANVTLTSGTMATINTAQTFTAVKTFDTEIRTNEIAPAGGQQLILFAGESKEASGYTGLTTEQVFIVAEGGLQVISSANNWTDATNGAWATANPAVIINNASGQSIFPGQVLTSDQFAANGATLNQLVTKRSGTYPTFILRNDGSNLYFLKTAAGSTVSESYDSTRPLTISFSTGELSSTNGQYFSGGMVVDTSLTVNPVIEATSGTAAKPGYTFSANNSVGIYLESNSLKFATSGVEVGYFGTGGNFIATNAISAGSSITNSATLADAGSVFIGSSGTFGTFTNLARLGVYKNSTLAQPNGYIRLDEADGTTQYVWLDVSDQMRFSPTSTNNGTTTGTLIGTQTSDERIKEIDPEFVYGIETVKRLKPMKYRLLTDPNKVDRLGFGAQTTREIVPEVVYDTNECIDGYTRDPNNEDNMIPNSDRTKLAMDGVQLIPVLTKALQESFEIIDSLKASISDLNMRIQTLETNSNK